MPDQLDRIESHIETIEKRLDTIHQLVSEHGGFIAGMKWVLGGLSAGLFALLAFIGSLLSSRH